MFCFNIFQMFCETFLYFWPLVIPCKSVCSLVKGYTQFKPLEVCLRKKKHSDLPITLKRRGENFRERLRKNPKEDGLPEVRSKWIPVHVLPGVFSWDTISSCNPHHWAPCNFKRNYNAGRVDVTVIHSVENIEKDGLIYICINSLNININLNFKS